ncbi:hypothetical protein LCGC14_0103940 [marine sediment metagenome]|uniref:histidine kinase n=1 Tax=marine sediment metagenome TaxID=412755 RepID=A0A0F9YD89_9ZZZZ
MLLVANDMLDLEKIESGKMDFTLNDLDLGQLVRDSIEENDGFAAQFGVTIESDLPDTAITIRGNSDRLAQVMANLLSNAIKFSPKDDVVKVSVADEGTGWRVSVADPGPGIAEEDKARIFDRFSQARPVDGVDRKGSGLGLHIVQNIVERHGGSIALESRIGVGTRFYFDLPKYEGSTTDIRHAAE